MARLQRYSGQPLGPKPHIVVLGSCKVGNFVVSTPVLLALRARFPDAVLGFLGSELTADFECAFSVLDWRLSWDDPACGAGLRLQQQIAERIRRYGPVGLALNLDGFNPVTCTLVPWLEPAYVAGGSLSTNLRRQLPWGDLPQQRFLADPDWDSVDFLKRYEGLFSSNYIAELFCQLAFVADKVDPTAIELPVSDPPFAVPDLLIHCTTARAAKVWPFSHWRQVVDFAAAKGWSVGLVGSPPAAQQEAYNAGDGEEALLAATALQDLRGRTSLMQLAGAAKRAKAVISVDAGPLHIAAAVGTPTLAVVGNDADGVGASPIRLWLPRCSNVSRTVATETCRACADNRFRNDACLVEGHPCMASVDPAQAIAWLQRVMPTQSGGAATARPDGAPSESGSGRESVSSP
jgi:heptosyltransferase-3